MTTRRLHRSATTSAQISSGTPSITLFDIQLPSVDIATVGFNANCRFIARDTSTQEVVSGQQFCAGAEVSGSMATYNLAGTNNGATALLLVSIQFTVVSPSRLVVSAFGLSGKTISWSAWIEIVSGEL